MESTVVKSYKDLIVWQKSIDLVVLIYELTNQFPREELYGLVSQMRRCAVSVPSNIAEGRRRSSRKELYHFTTISFGSRAELETQIEITKRLPFGKRLDFSQIDRLLDEVMRMLNAMLGSLQATS